MAIDELLLRSARSAILRFYRWTEPAVSFGYFGQWQEAQQFAGDRPIVRRWTGGGIVPHGADLTYSIMIGRDEMACSLSSRTIYERIHKIIGDRLRLLGVDARLVTTAIPKVSASCFANPVVADVMEGDRKIAGAAHRKTRSGLLHQGSIQRGDLDESFRDGMASYLGQRVVPHQINPQILREASQLAKEKYATAAWLWRR